MSLFISLVWHDGHEGYGDIYNTACRNHHWLGEMSLFSLCNILTIEGEFALKV